MPHFGLMDENALGPIEGLLMRTKLHIRGGEQRLRKGRISMGILTLYDALDSAMQWYIALPENRKALQIKESEDMRDDKTVYAVLSRSGVLNGDFDYGAFDELVEKALEQEMSDYDYIELLKNVKSVMTQLGVMPFDENELPPEDPSTF